ncbi:MAG: AbrB family transcriptional regulator [Burkholderiaceae bacterium]|nr:AbrB family transcriptional regulator [Burkholderiaceae bacterium]MDO9089399.1 AbrB family transcriptional regulator [Burkholderiaceae bacterium]MDP1967743.1 AbrB family transcriptional regulator [Burkholderiaceae bacterium]
MRSKVLHSFPVRASATLLLSVVAAWAFDLLRLPLPWILGPLVAVGGASMMGAPTASWTPLRNAGQLTIGAALGLYFTPAVAAVVASLWWIVGLSILWAFALGMVFGYWLYRVNKDRMPGLTRASAFYAGAIGGASEMTLLAERSHANARTDLVAAAHSLRMVMVAVLVPFAFTFSGLHGVDLTPAGPRITHLSGLALLLGLGVGCAWLLGWMGRSNPWFMGSLLVATGLTLAEIHLSAIPTWLSNAAQLTMGASMGVRFTAGFVHTAPRWLGTVMVGTLAMIVLCAAFGWALAWASGLPAATMILATAPGGIAEMAITAKVLQLGAAVVTTCHVCRLVAVLTLIGPLFRKLGIA